MSIGKLRERITIEKVTPTADGGGGETRSWTTLDTVWARVAPLKGFEAVQAMQLQERIDYRVTIRHRTDVTNEMRVVWGTKTLSILSVTNDDEKDRYLTLRCQSKKPS